MEFADAHMEKALHNGTYGARSWVSISYTFKPCHLPRSAYGAPVRLALLSLSLSRTQLCLEIQISTPYYVSALQAPLQFRGPLTEYSLRYSNR